MTSDVVTVMHTSAYDTCVLEHLVHLGSSINGSMCVWGAFNFKCTPLAVDCVVVAFVVGDDIGVYRTSLAENSKACCLSCCVATKQVRALASLIGVAYGSLNLPLASTQRKLTFWSCSTTRFSAASRSRTCRHTLVFHQIRTACV